MKRFDPEAIKIRLLNYLRQFSHWKNIQKDGATEQFLEALVEPFAEDARYGEYLLQELKWDTSRNFSSAKHIARLVGKKLNRPRSAIGTITVSHSDINGIARYKNLGVSNFAIDNRSDFDDIKQDTSLTDSIYQNALVPWTSEILYNIPVGATFHSKSGIPFVCAKKSQIRPWSSYWTDIKDSEGALATFKTNGGWEGYKYLTVPIVQGRLKTLDLGETNGKLGQVFTVSAMDIEAADNYYTKQFCYIEITLPDGTVERWEEVQHLSTAYSTDKVFEIEIRDDLLGTNIRFGDDRHGALPVPESYVTLHYLETKGSGGNIPDLFNFESAISGVNLPDVPGWRNLTVGCQNMWSILGGKDLETLSEFKENAETAYANNYEILHTYTELLERINLVSPIPIIKPRVSDILEETLVGSTKVYTYKIGVSGLNTALKTFSSTERNLFQTILNKEINDRVLSNKAIKYYNPKLIKLDSDIECKLVEPTIKAEVLEAEIEDLLTQTVGKASVNALDFYSETQLIKIILEKYGIFSSVKNSTLFTIDSSSLELGYIGSEERKYILFNFESPSILDSTGDYLCKTFKEGLEVPFIFNLNINNNKKTLACVYTSDSGIVNNFITETGSILSIYNQEKETNPISLKELKAYQKTFPPSELRDSSALNTAPENEWDYTFFVEPKKGSVRSYLAVPLGAIATWLGFEYVETDLQDVDFIDKVKEALEVALDNHTAEITFSYSLIEDYFKGDWDTIVYYDNISVTLV